jgi:hypothetical protein
LDFIQVLSDKTNSISRQITMNSKPPQGWSEARRQPLHNFNLRPEGGAAANLRQITKTV